MVLSDFDDFDRKQFWNITKVCENGENSVLWGLEKVYDTMIFIPFLISSQNNECRGNKVC